MGRKIAIFWHASFSILAGIGYYLAVLPRTPELMGEISHSFGTTSRIGCGILIGLTALPVVFTLLRTRKPELGTAKPALTLQTVSIVAHVLAAVLIIGTAVSEIWLRLDAAGQWLFGLYGAAAAIAVLGVFAFYLSFVAELPPKPPKPKKDKRTKKGTDAEADQTAEAAEIEAEKVEALSETEDTDTEDAETVAAEEAGPEAESDDLPTAEDTIAVEAPRGGLRNRRPSGKSAGSRRRRRSRGGVVAVDDDD
ncbi:MAG: hypothetical protein WA317_12410 [Mycobacterium sp.]|uniref:hypothetical protein n=1 Tax=Mycobacterium sp. TaxID=1785 RepID=UPI003CC54DAC